MVLLMMVVVVVVLVSLVVLVLALGVLVLANLLMALAQLVALLELLILMVLVLVVDGAGNCFGGINPGGIVHGGCVLWHNVFVGRGGGVPDNLFPAPVIHLVGSL